jgi:non-ribosomal peptide synthetase component E (peptide arylation enzyme)
MGRLASYKIPKKFIAIQSIPKNAMGKINKKELVKSDFITSMKE